MKAVMVLMKQLQFSFGMKCRLEGAEKEEVRPLRKQ
jgi:hypothetical protein